MRRLLTAVAFTLAASGVASAQSYTPPNHEAQRAAIARLAPLTGQWEGTAEVRGAHAMTVHQVERVEIDLNGMILTFRGNGYDNPAHTGAPVFQAFAVTSFNDHTNEYELRTYTDGYASNATAEFLPDGAFRWSVGAGPGTRMRFTIWFDATTWRETGEISTDGGATWRETIELNLRKVS